MCANKLPAEYFQCCAFIWKRSPEQAALICSPGFVKTAGGPCTCEGPRRAAVREGEHRSARPTERTLRARSTSSASAQVVRNGWSDCTPWQLADFPTGGGVIGGGVQPRHLVVPWPPPSSYSCRIRRNRAPTGDSACLRYPHNLKAGRSVLGYP
jgi:hypothetical protein